MMLEIILPPAPRACDRNHGKVGVSASGENKRARLVAKARTLEAMRVQGVAAMFNVWIKEGDAK